MVLMRRALGILLWLSLALGQVIVVPEGGRVGEPLELLFNLPPGTYDLGIESPEGEVRVETLEAEGGALRYRFVPEAAGTYRFFLELEGEPYVAELPVAPFVPRLDGEGLWLSPAFLLTLPEPERWLGPLVEGERVYVARELLVLEVDPAERSVRRHYPPNLVEALLPGPRVRLVDGRELDLAELGGLPFEAPWETLAGLRALEEALGPYEGYRPYWSLLAEKPRDPEALTRVGRDLLLRGHRVELSWADHPFGYLVAAAREGDLAAARFLLDYAPGVPGSEALFREVARGLGDEAEAVRFAQAAEWVRHYRRLGLGRIALAVALFFLAAYLALLIKGLLLGGRLLGGRLGFFERVLLAVFLLLALGFGGVYAGLLPVEGRLVSFSRASLATLPAQRALRELEALAPPVVSAAQALGRGEAARALALDSHAGAVLEGLKVGGDPWSAVYREAGLGRGVVPSERELELLFAAAQLGRLAADPAGSLKALFPNPLIVIGALVLAGALLLAHLLALALGRPAKPGSLVLVYGALVPGVLWFASGVGLLLFAAFLLGAYLLYEGRPEGALWLGAAYVLNLLLLALALLGRKR